jgi:hypothetical protein
MGKRLMATGGDGEQTGKEEYNESLKGGSETMITITDGKWIADLGNMTYLNIENRIAVALSKTGKT